MSPEDVTKLTENYKELRHDVNELRQSVSNATGSLHRIEKALMGDAEMMHTGIVKTVQSHSDILIRMDQRIRDIKDGIEIQETLKKNDKWWIAAITSAITAIGAWVINFFIKH